MTPSRVSASTLKTWLDQGAAVAVVDVRDLDRFGGHIRGSINVPSETFLSQLASLPGKLQGKDKIVFHCQLSQQRGPSCARAFARYISDAGHGFEVYILDGGFDGWAHKFGTDERVTEAFRREIYRV